MWLSTDIFSTVVASTPLISIDLVVQNAQGNVLLGHRVNRPAQGFWFVPGGRILKNESLDTAFLRLTQEELGQAFKRSQARLIGIYEHFYEDSVFGTGDTTPSTHYVVLGYQLVLFTNQHLELPHTQHDQYRWWSPLDMQGSTAVHKHTQAYLSALA